MKNSWFRLGSFQNFDCFPVNSNFVPVQPSQKPNLRFGRPLCHTRAVRYAGGQPVEAWQTCGLPHGYTGSGKDNQVVLLQGVKEWCGEVDLAELHFET